MCSQAVIYLDSHVTDTKHTALARLMKRLGSSWFARVLSKPAPMTQDDPYLLLLLADQAFDAGREEQAIYLVETVYEVFDRQKNITHLRHMTRKSRIAPGNTAIGLSTI